MIGNRRHIDKYDPLLFKGIAHRGLHDDNIPENSMAAFQKALDAGCAMECDIHLTKDKELVICHDSELERVTGKKGIIEEMTLAELRENYKLKDGSDLPTLNELLDLVQEKVPVVVEMKAYKRNGVFVGRRTRKLLQRIKDKKKITVISFDPRCLIQFNFSPFTRGLLLTTEYEWVKRFATMFDYLDVEDKMAPTPSIASYAKHEFINVWTVRSEEQLEALLPHADMITFEGMPLEKVREAIARHKEQH